MSERLDIRLTSLYPDFSRSRIKGLIEAGFVKVNGESVIKAGAKVSDGDEIDVTIPPPVPAEPEPEDIPLNIIFEDDDILVIDKPAGLVVHPAPGHHTGTLVNAILFHCPDLKGIGGSLLIAGAGTVAIYCWLNPDARKSAIRIVEKQWSNVKDFGDDVVDEIKDIDVPRSSEPIIKVDLD